MGGRVHGRTEIPEAHPLDRRDGLGGDVLDPARPEADDDDAWAGRHGRSTGRQDPADERIPQAETWGDVDL